MRQKAIFMVLGFKAFKLKEALVICSAPRSGSTWLIEMLSKFPEIIINWEPIHSTKGVVPNKRYLGERPFIEKDEDNGQLFTFFKNVFCFKRFNTWTTRYAAFKIALKSKKVVTKFVRANPLLPYFAHNFGLKYKPILLVRHPVPTCQSIIKAFGNQTRELLNFEPPETLNNERFMPHVEYINQLQTRLEQQIALWCIDNVDVVETKDPQNWHLIPYEAMMANPIDTLKDISNLWHLKVNKNTFKAIAIDKPSRTTYKGDLRKDPKSQIEKYLEVLTNEELDRIQAIFNYFGLKYYKAHHPYPLDNY
ncbi:sulfotransferase family protein [Winogradskyella sp. A3E31]|uniref:sulfotransferase family protein n=1 Tax=Winogradskyella sp. A3E31 TaxID=3349637 RepID=UPI00398A6439